MSSWRPWRPRKEIAGKPERGLPAGTTVYLRLRRSAPAYDDPPPATTDRRNLTTVCLQLRRFFSGYDEPPPHTTVCRWLRRFASRYDGPPPAATDCRCVRRPASRYDGFSPTATVRRTRRQTVVPGDRPPYGYDGAPRGNVLRPVLVYTGAGSTVLCQFGGVPVSTGNKAEQGSRVELSARNTGKDNCER
jgi:hypothetical protein